MLADRVSPPEIGEREHLEPHSLLIAADFSDESLAALMLGFATASGWRATPHVLHVCREVGGQLAIDRHGDSMLVTPEQAQRTVADHVDQCLALYRITQGEPTFDVVVSHVVTGDAATSIVKLAEELQVSLVVVGRSGAQGALGSTAERVVRTASMGVLVSRRQCADTDEQTEPTCAACIDVRQRSSGTTLWCQYHREPQARRHTFHYRDIGARSPRNLPLLVPMAPPAP